MANELLIAFLFFSDGPIENSTDACWVDFLCIVMCEII